MYTKQPRSKSRLNIYTSDLCKKTTRKKSGLARVASFMSFNKRKLLMSVFLNSYFSYCRLIWMCHNRPNNRKIGILHEICLRIVYNDVQ